MRATFDHLFCIGGSACAGKSAVAHRVADELGLTLYSCDEAFADHRLRADPARHPTFRRLMDLTTADLLRPPPAVQAADLLAFYAEEWELVAADLAALPGPVVAEGVGLLPEQVLQALPDPRRAVWLIADDAFRLAVYPRRGEWVRELLAGCADPDRAFARWMERDGRVAGELAASAERCGGTVLRVDGRRSVEAIAAEVVERFGHSRR